MEGVGLPSTMQIIGGYCVSGSGQSVSVRHLSIPMTKIVTGGSSSTPLSASFSQRSNQRSWMPVRSIASLLAEAPNSRSGKLPVKFMWVQGPMITRWLRRVRSVPPRCRMPR